MSSRPPSPENLPPQRRLRVLVVEDNAAAAQTTGWMIEITGHDYRLAHDGDAAIAEAQAYMPDVVVLDIGLPGMNGFELCRRLRVLPGVSRAVFIALTGWGRDDYRHMAGEAGFDHFVIKPLNMVTLETLFGEAASATAAREGAAD
ncbi:MAG: response regulator [Asticcacaulis sp.]